MAKLIDIKPGLKVETVSGFSGTVEAVLGNGNYIVLSGVDFAGYNKTDRTVSIDDIVRQEAATEKQIAYLRSMKVELDHEISKKWASILIDAAINNELSSFGVFKTDGSN